MRIAVDIDGVLGDFIKNLAPIVNDIFPGRIGDNYQPKDWDFTDVLSKEEFKLVWRAVKQCNNFWLKEPGYNQNITELINFWIDNPTLEIYFVTSRVQTAGASVLIQTAKWLEKMFLYPKKNGQSQIITVADAKYKADVITALGIQYSLDDYAETVSQCSHLEGHTAYLLDRPWNKHADALLRVYSVHEYLQKTKEN